MNEQYIYIIIYAGNGVTGCDSAYLQLMTDGLATASHLIVTVPNSLTFLSGETVIVTSGLSNQRELLCH